MEVAQGIHRVTAFRSKRELHVGKTIVLDDAHVQSSAVGTGKPPYSKKCHLNLIAMCHSRIKQQLLTVFEIK